ncbi:MAG TPA: hypothetical protein VGR29_10310 [Thermomicrobiales bacterium]|nr:hypothetical protein [Thermomicrobiales bacterium]
MVTETEMPAVSFSGSKQLQETASRAFDVMRARGMFVADNAPIRVNKDDLIAFLTTTGDVSASEVDEALAENANVFLVEANGDGAEVVITTRMGRAPSRDAATDGHTFANRLMTPEPKPTTPVAPVRERVRVDPSWATFTVPDVGEDEEDDELVAQETLTAVIAAPEVVEDVGAEEPMVAATEVPVAPVEPEFTAAEMPVAPAEPEVIEEPIETPAPAAEVIEDVPAAPAVTDPVEVIEESLAVETAEPVEVAAPVEVAPPVRPIEIPAPVEVAPPAAFDRRIASDARQARFGNQSMPEDRVHRLSRGELRRIREYIEEQEQPLTDETLVQDILGVRPNNPNYEFSLFSVNYRLSKEREFEFVGTSDQRFWATTTLPSIGTDRRKHNDIGTDYRFLAEEVDLAAAPRSVESLDHVVTFYEHTLGLLPYDAAMQKLMPAPMLPDQRNAVFTFEIPQTYTTYLVELRYPTPNRGGFLLGLDDFYADSVVPGAIISVSATENDGHYKVEYLEADDQEDRLLELDDRRAPRYHFRPTTYSCVVDSDWLINESRFPNLGSEKPLADKVRRRNDAVLKATFERIGMDDGDGGKLASFEDLLAAINIERPFSAAALRAALEADPAVSGDDANGYVYASGS